MSAAAQQSLRKRTKAEVSEAFIQRLSDRRSIDLEVPGVIESIQKHFQLLPTRYALDVNLGSLDVLNHKRLLDSARADPSAVSFQVRPVDVVVGHGHTSMSRRPSFGNLDGFGSEVSTAAPDDLRGCCSLTSLNSRILLHRQLLLVQLTRDTPKAFPGLLLVPLQICR